MVVVVCVCMCVGFDCVLVVVGCDYYWIDVVYDVFVVGCCVVWIGCCEYVCVDYVVDYCFVGVIVGCECCG